MNSPLFSQRWLYFLDGKWHILMGDSHESLCRRTNCSPTMKVQAAKPRGFIGAGACGPCSAELRAKMSR